MTSLNPIFILADVDECEEKTYLCPGGNTSQCFNTPGSFECRCKPGYMGNPNSDQLGCIDINECHMADHYCGQNADCVNYNGGYECNCHQGYAKRFQEEQEEPGKGLCEGMQI